MDFSWFPHYLPMILYGIWLTLLLLVISITVGFAFAVPIGLVQVTGPRWLKWLFVAACWLGRKNSRSGMVTGENPGRRRDRKSRRPVDRLQTGQYDTPSFLAR